MPKKRVKTRVDQKQQYCKQHLYDTNKKKNLKQRKRDEDLGVSVDVKPIGNENNHKESETGISIKKYKFKPISNSF